MSSPLSGGLPLRILDLRSSLSIPVIPGDRTQLALRIPGDRSHRIQSMSPPLSALRIPGRGERHFSLRAHSPQDSWTFAGRWEPSALLGKWGKHTPGRGILDHRPPRKSHQNIIVATRVWARSFDLVGSHRAELHSHLGFFFVAGNKERESIQWVCDQWSKTVVT